MTEPNGRRTEPTGAGAAAGGTDAERAGDTIADVDHTAPYPEPNDVWSRGFARASDDSRDVRR